MTLCTIAVLIHTVGLGPTRLSRFTGLGDTAETIATTCSTLSIRGA